MDRCSWITKLLTYTRALLITFLCGNQKQYFEDTEAIGHCVFTNHQPNPWSLFTGLTGKRFLKQLEKSKFTASIQLPPLWNIVEISKNKMQKPREHTK